MIAATFPSDFPDPTPSTKMQAFRQFGHDPRAHLAIFIHRLAGEVLDTPNA
jgi:hypothetical protein